MSRVNEIRYVGYAVSNLEAGRSFHREKWGLLDAELFKAPEA